MRFLILFFAACQAVAFAGSASPAAPASEVPPPNAAAAKCTIVHDNQTFELANSTATKTVETDEYTASGEKLGEWTQLVTVQRLRLGGPATAASFVDYFKQKVAEDGASLEVLSPGKVASVFAVRFPKSDRNDEQVMICLAFSDAAKPELMNIVQYAIKPARCSVAEVASRIKSWRDKFVAQARALGSAS